MYIQTIRNVFIRHIFLIHKPSTFVCVCVFKALLDNQPIETMIKALEKM